jgi:hypothetical protein
MDNSQTDDMGNEGFLDMMNMGSSAMNWGGTPDYSPIGEQATMPTQNVSTSTKQRSTKSTSIKGKNWSSVEDKVLIEAWANTSLDAVVGKMFVFFTFWNWYGLHKCCPWWIYAIC